MHNPGRPERTATGDGKRKKGSHGRNPRGTGRDTYGRTTTAQDSADGCRRTLSEMYTQLKFKHNNKQTNLRIHRITHTVGTHPATAHVNVRHAPLERAAGNTQTHNPYP